MTSLRNFRRNQCLQPATLNDDDNDDDDRPNGGITRQKQQASKKLYYSSSILTYNLCSLNSRETL